MAKKKHKKKHNFQHKNAPAAVAPIASSVASKGSKAQTMPNEWGEVRDDVNKTLILGAVFIVLMIGLWVLLDFTSVGSTLYNAIKL